MAFFVGANVIDIKTVDEFELILKQSKENPSGTEMLHVIDVYKEWCGRCETMQFFFDQIVMSNDRIEERVAFRSVDQELVADQIKGILPPWSNINIDTKGCCPLFIFIKNGEMVGEVSGCNSPEVTRQIMEFIPPIPEDEDEETH